MSIEEIRTKWIRHTPLMNLDECVDNAMQEYSDQNTKPLIDEIEQQKMQCSVYHNDILNLEGEKAGLLDEIAELKSRLELSEQQKILNYNCLVDANDEIAKLKLDLEYAENGHLAIQKDYDKLFLENSKLKASKSEVNEADLWK